MINILKEIFYVITGALVVFCCLEIIWPNIILAFLNINVMLLVWLIDAILILVISRFGRDKIRVI